MTDHREPRSFPGPSVDVDPAETAEWKDALASLLASHGPVRARLILDELSGLAQHLGVGWSPELSSPYGIERKSCVRRSSDRTGTADPTLLDDALVRR